MAKYASNGDFKAQTRDLVRQAGLVSYGVELTDLYIDLVLAGRMRFKEAAKAYTSFISPDNIKSTYNSGSSVLHPFCQARFKLEL